LIRGESQEGAGDSVLPVIVIDEENAPSEGGQSAGEVEAG
jgi:hypothetical protein